jgi:hypothetical protein
LNPEGALSKLVLLGWGFFVYLTTSNGRMREIGGLTKLVDRVKRAELPHPRKASLGAGRAFLQRLSRELVSICDVGNEHPKTSPKWGERA